MTRMPVEKYRPFPPIDLSDRQWPGRTIMRAPTWCSVDLRDGNQALVEPMGVVRKRRLFDQLVRMGFNEIEVGFPSASATEYEFVREVIESDNVPEDVTLQVLTQAREELIRRTMQSVRGTKRVIVHVYNSTSTVQRSVVFRQDRAGVVDIAVRAVRLVKELDAEMPETEVVLQYSPESFTQTELDFAVEICDAVVDVWGASPERPVILNLPSTVEVSTPNVYADQIEWFGRHVGRRDSVVLSVHPHNDRGTAVAAAELALMAGAERVEGTLFGNGERTGNVDVVTLAMNLYSQGVAPGLALSDLGEIARVAAQCTRLPVHPRHPYVGELVYTAFSGSHQDAIRKGMAAVADSEEGRWEVPYLPIDPADVGRSYEAVIRINSQSGKGGVAWVMERDHGIHMPRGLQVEFSRCVQAKSDASEEEVPSKVLRALFEEEFVHAEGRYGFGEQRSVTRHDGVCDVEVQVVEGGVPQTLCGTGTGPIDAFVDALRRQCGVAVEVLDYSEHGMGEGADAVAIAFVQVRCDGAPPCYGVGRDSGIVGASLRAIVSGLNRSLRARAKAA